jgi:hypothetical protein
MPSLPSSTNQVILTIFLQIVSSMPKDKILRWSAVHNEELNANFVAGNFDPESVKDDEIAAYFEALDEDSPLGEIGLVKFKTHYRKKAVDYLNSMALSGIRRKKLATNAGATTSGATANATAKSRQLSELISLVLPSSPSLFRRPHSLPFSPFLLSQNLHQHRHQQLQLQLQLQQE